MEIGYNLPILNQVEFTFWILYLPLVNTSNISINRIIALRKHRIE